MDLMVETRTGKEVGQSHLGDDEGLARSCAAREARLEGECSQPHCCLDFKSTTLSHWK